MAGLDEPIDEAPERSVTRGKSAVAGFAVGAVLLSQPTLALANKAAAASS